MSNKFFRLAAAIAGFCALAVPQVSADTAPLQDAILALPTFSLTFSHAYLAEDLGLFEKHGARVKLVEISGVGSMNAVISGSVDFAQTSGAALTRGAARGQALLAIVETIDRPAIQIVLRNEIASAGGFDPQASLTARAAILRGRTIAVESVNSIPHAYLRLVAARGGFDPEEIRIAPMQPPNMIASFAARQIDGFSISPPWPQQVLLDGSAVMIASGPDGDPADMAPFANSVVVTKGATCARNPALCDAIGQAYADAVEVIAAQPQMAVEVLKKRFATMDEKLLTAAFAVIAKITPHPPVASRAALENADRFNIDAGLLQPADRLPAYDGLFTDKYAR